MLQQPFLLLIILYSLALQVRAEIILDGTLGTQGPLSGPAFDINAQLGQQQGQNLFHSFSQFNLATGEQATFSGPDNVKNVINRVTGGHHSQINGTLRVTIPQAHFYFLNPAGVMFGEGAKLDLSGHFYVSTADRLYFEEGQYWSVTQSNSILTVASPTAFGFLETPIAPIQVTQTELAVQNHQNLSLIGGHIQIQDGGLYVPAGAVNLFSVASPGTVDLESADLSHFTQLGQIKLIAATLGQSPYQLDGASHISIRGGQFYHSDSVLNGKIFKNNETSTIDIDCREQVVLEQNAIITTDSFSAVDAGNITIKTDVLTIEQAEISNHTQQGGVAGLIKIEANQITINNGVRLTSHSDNKGEASGQIQITAQEGLKMTGEVWVATTTSDNTSPLTGSITIKAGDIQMAGDATLDTTAAYNAKSGGGEVIIQADQLIMKDRAWIISSSFGQGQSGAIKISANTLNLSGESAIASTTFSQGQGGEIIIHIGDSLSLSDIAAVTSGTEGSGQGGNIFITLPSTYPFQLVDNISAANEVKNVVTEEIFRIFEQTKKLGDQIDGHIFAGGGQAGRVYITYQDTLVNSRIADSSTQIQFTTCPMASEQKNVFTIQKREGLFEVFELF